MKLLLRLYRDEHGTVLSAELMMLVVLLAIGIIVAAKSFRDGTVTEFADYAQAIGNLDQSYNCPNIIDMGMVTVVGSGFADGRDFCDNDAAAATSNNTKYTDTICAGTPTNFATPATPE